MNTATDKKAKINAKQKPDILGALLKHTAKHKIQHHYYFDRLSIYFDAHAPHDLLNELESLSGKNKLIRPSTLHGYIRFNQKLELYQVDDKALAILEKISKTTTAYLINYIEIAIDFYGKKQESLSKLRCFFNKHLIAKRRGSKKIFYFYCYNKPAADDATQPKEFVEKDCYDIANSELTHYFSAKKKSVRSVIYNDSKNYRWDTQYGYVHIEFRYSGLEAVGNLDILTIDDLIKFNHFSYWRKNLVIMQPIQKLLGEIDSPFASKNSNPAKRGKYLFDKIQSLQAFMSIYPEHINCFKDMTTEQAVEKFCKL